MDPKGGRPCIEASPIYYQTQEIPMNQKPDHDPTLHVCPKCGRPDSREIATEHNAANPPVELTKDEAELVVDLILLYNAIYDDRPDSSTCRCVMCLALDQAGGHQSSTYASLKAKCSACGQADDIPLAIEMDEIRNEFERWISAPPFKPDTQRYLLDATKSASLGYHSYYPMELAWEAWKEAQRKYGTKPK